MENSRDYYVAKAEEALKIADKSILTTNETFAKRAQAAAFVAAQYIELAKMAREE